MSLIPEDGTGVSGANSYNSLQEIVDYAALRGLSSCLPESEPAICQLAIRAMDQLEMRSYCGQRTYEDQPLSHPRTGMTVDCEEIPSDLIHPKLKQAQIELMFSLQEGNDPMAVQTSQGQVVERQVDVLRIKYANNSSSSSSFSPNPRVNKVENLLREMLCSGGPGGPVTFIRV